MRNFVLTSNSVTSGHPDKLCDLISDAVVDRVLGDEPAAQVNAECAISTGIVFLAVHISRRNTVDLGQVVREAIAGVGYKDPDFNAQRVSILSTIQPLEPRDGDDRWTEGMTNVTVFGYATNTTPEYLPLPIALAHRLARRLEETRRAARIGLHPDGQAQVAVRFENRIPVAINGLTLYAGSEISADRPGAVSGAADELRQRLVEPVLRDAGVPLSDDAVIFVNPRGAELVGGPVRHSGLTGRKNDIDTYGGFCRHSGSALSGKDPSRIDRTAAYAARYAAKNVVAAGLADECEVQVSYTIGRTEPLSVDIDTFATARVAEERIRSALLEAMNFGAEAVQRRFDLANLPRSRDGVFFRQLAVFGHMGRLDVSPPWEELDIAEWLAKRCGG